MVYIDINIQIIQDIPKKQKSSNSICIKYTYNFHELYKIYTLYTKNTKRSYYMNNKTCTYLFHTGKNKTRDEIVASKFEKQISSST